MADIKIQKNMYPILITTNGKYQHLLPDFFTLANKFWPGQKTFIVDVAKPEESWTAQMIRVIDEQNLGGFIRLSEDFYLSQPVDVETLEHLCQVFDEDASVFRIGLQSVHDGYEGNVEQDGDLWRVIKDYSGSMEASILHGQELYPCLLAAGDMHVWEFEGFATRWIQERGCKALVPSQKVLSYMDATRRGETRIKREGNQFMILKPGDVWEPFASV